MTRTVAVPSVIAALAIGAPAAAVASTPEAPPSAPALAIAVFPLDGYALARAVEMAPVHLTARLSTLLGDRGHRIVDPILGLTDMSLALGCASPDDACLAMIAREVKADGVVYGELRADSAGVRVKLRLLAVSPAVKALALDEVVELTAAGLHAELDGVAERFLTPPKPEPERIVTTVAPITTPVAADAVAAAVVSTSTGGGGLRALRFPGVAAVGAGAVLVVVAVPMGLRTARLSRDYDAAPDGTLEEIGALRDLDRRGRTSAIVTDVLLGAGVVAAGAGAAMIAVSFAGRRRAPSVSAAVAPVPGGAMFVAAGSFGGRRP